MLLWTLSFLIIAKMFLFLSETLAFVITMVSASQYDSRCHGNISY